MPIERTKRKQEHPISEFPLPHYSEYGQALFVQASAGLLPLLAENGFPTRIIDESCICFQPEESRRGLTVMMGTD